VSDDYVLVRSRATAAEFHGRAVGAPAHPEVWSHDLVAPAVVLGSSQPDGVVDAAACRRAGVEVVRRRSGGGAVLLVPGEVTWLDVIVPAGSTGWSDDIHGPMVWLGHHLAGVFAGLGVESDLTVHEGRPLTTTWSAALCFDGVGAGEVLLDGRKLVGISQRRTRHAARLQCCWYSRHDPSALLGFLAREHRPPADALQPVATLHVDGVAERLVQTLR
jgi:lipoate---protein ligase